MTVSAGDNIKVYRHGDPEPEVTGGTIAVVNYGDYRTQEIWVASGSNIGNWYPLGGEFGAPKVAEDPRTTIQQMVDPRGWQQPPGTVPSYPTWDDMTARGPVVIVTATNAESYARGWTDGRARLLAQVEELRDDEDVPPGHGWRS